MLGASYRRVGEREDKLRDLRADTTIDSLSPPPIVLTSPSRRLLLRALRC